MNRESSAALHSVISGITSPPVGEKPHCAPPTVPAKYTAAIYMVGAEVEATVVGAAVIKAEVGAAVVGAVGAETEEREDR